MKQTTTEVREQSFPLNAAFLVRCRYEDQQWRFILENVATREQKGFASIESLSVFLETFLREQTG